MGVCGHRLSEAKLTIFRCNLFIRTDHFSLLHLHLIANE